MKFYDELKWRGLLKDEAGEDLEKVINEKNASFYWGWLFGIIGLIVVCGLPNRLENKNIVVNISKYDELEKLQSLKVKGILTQQEYELEKQKILES